MLLIAKAPPTAPDAAVLRPETENETDRAPAPAMISESLTAFTVTTSCGTAGPGTGAASCSATSLVRRLAVVSPVMLFVEPEPAAASAEEGSAVKKIRPAGY